MWAHFQVFFSPSIFNVPSRKSVRFFQFSSLSLLQTEKGCKPYLVPHRATLLKCSYTTANIFQLYETSSRIRGCIYVAVQTFFAVVHRCSPTDHPLPLPLGTGLARETRDQQGWQRQKLVPGTWNERLCVAPFVNACHHLLIRSPDNPRSSYPWAGTVLLRVGSRTATGLAPRTAPTTKSPEAGEHTGIEERGGGGWEGRLSQSRKQRTRGVLECKNRKPRN